MVSREQMPLPSTEFNDTVGTIENQDALTGPEIELYNLMESYADISMAIFLKGAWLTTTGSYDTMNKCAWVKEGGFGPEMLGAIFQGGADDYLKKEAEEIKIDESRSDSDIEAGEVPDTSVQDGVVENAQDLVINTDQVEAVVAHVTIDSNAPTARSSDTAERKASEVVTAPNKKSSSAHHSSIEVIKKPETAGDAVVSRPVAPIENVNKVEHVEPAVEPPVIINDAISKPNEIIKPIEVVKLDNVYELETVDVVASEAELPTESVVQTQSELKEATEIETDANDELTVGMADEMVIEIPTEEATGLISQVHESELEELEMIDTHHTDVLDTLLIPEEIEPEPTDTESIDITEIVTQAEAMEPELSDDIEIPELVLPAPVVSAEFEAVASEEVSPHQEKIESIHALLAELAVDADTTEEVQEVAEVPVPEKLTELYECLEAQVSSLEQDTPDIEIPNRVYKALEDVLREAGMDDADYYAKLYIQTYGIAGLHDFALQPAINSKTKLAVQYEKMAGFVTGMLVHHDRPYSASEAA